MLRESINLELNDNRLCDKISLTVTFKNSPCCTDITQWPVQYSCAPHFVFSGLQEMWYAAQTDINYTVACTLFQFKKNNCSVQKLNQMQSKFQCDWYFPKSEMTIVSVQIWNIVRENFQWEGVLLSHIHFHFDTLPFCRIHFMYPIWCSDVPRKTTLQKSDHKYITTRQWNYHPGFTQNANSRYVGLRDRTSNYGCHGLLARRGGQDLKAF